MPAEIFAVNYIQQTKIQDNLNCDASSNCTNSGENIASVHSGDINIIEQNLKQINGCIQHPYVSTLLIKIVELRIIL